MAVEGHQRPHRHIHGAQLRRAAKFWQVDHETRCNNLGTNLAQQLDRAFRRATGRDQVIVNQHPRPIEDRVGMDFKRVRPVLELILDRDRLGGEPTGFTGRDETDVQRLGQGPAEDEPA